ncbi:MAG: class I SAM-dependent methyltransferase [Paracoccaceae bacterium]|nr:class I SAM-dependent methyltransferase [Paracoccaceae bacterium]
MDRLSDKTREIYDRHAVAYDAHRNKALFERAWIDRAVADVPAGGAVLDLGCGAGEPIARYLFDRSFDVTGVDFAPGMLRIFQRRFPDATAIAADMRSLDLGRSFDAIIGWGSFFHLTPDEQRATLPRIAGHLAAGGRLLLTVGHVEGEVTGRVEGTEVYHSSLSEAEYRSILWISGLMVEAFVPEDPNCDFHTLLLARRSL